jgi:pilus assembly protein Flp/PilA
MECNTPACFKALLEFSPTESNTMKNALMKLHMFRHGLLNGEEGQDLVEYALLVSLVALGCIASVGYVATAITSIFSNISTSIA